MNITNTMKLQIKNENSALNSQVGGNYYKKMKIQSIEFIHANEMPFIEGSIIKYISRWREKKDVLDLEKAKYYIEILIELETKQNDQS